MRLADEAISILISLCSALQTRGEEDPLDPLCLADEHANMLIEYANMLIC
jgi:hypothetical protein